MIEGIMTYSTVARSHFDIINCTPWSAPQFIGLQIVHANALNSEISLSLHALTTISKLFTQLDHSDILFLCIAPYCPYMHESVVINGGVHPTSVIPSRLKATATSGKQI